LYRWRYHNLGDLPHVLQQPEYLSANPGFVFDYQLIDVQDFNGVGESEPVPPFYQNLAEAEYVVATFMYMRLLGYPAEKITILTTYNGQKHLIRDVVGQRCSSNPFIGEPHKITTVDKFQGQQNDFILLSLVRTKTVGHLRDVRRLVVAMSRARLGLYVFARVSLFKNCFELTPSFDILVRRPDKLNLLPQEPVSAPVREQGVGDSEKGLIEKARIIQGMPEMVQFVYELYHQLVEKWKHEKPELFRQKQAPEVEVEAQEVEGEDGDEDEDEDEDKKSPQPPETETEGDDNDKQETKPKETEEDENEVGFEKLTEQDMGVEDMPEVMESNDQ
jgi:intron-binding protein aquarius